MLTKILYHIANWATTYHRRVLMISFCVTVVSLFFIMDMRINLSFFAIMPEDEEIKHFEKAVRDFGGSSDLLLVIESRSSQQAKDFANELANNLVKLKEKDSSLGVRSIDYKFDFDFLKDNGLLFVPENILEQVENTLIGNEKKLQRLYSDLHLAPYLENIYLFVHQLALQMKIKATEPDKDELIQLLKITNTTFKIAQQYVEKGEKVEEDIVANEIKSFLTRNDAEGMADLFFNDGYLFSADQKTMLVSIRLNGDIINMPFGFTFYKDILSKTEEIAQKYPGLKATYTGMMAMGYEDQTFTLQKFQWLSVLSLLLVILLFLFISRLYVGPIIIAVTMIMAMIWTFAMVKIFLGFVSLTSMIFVVLLFGLGIDFAIHLMVRINEEFALHSNYDKSIRRAIQTTGRGVITGGFTTVLAFLSMCIADDKSTVHLGFTTGTGLFFCLVSMIIVFPAFLYATFRSKYSNFIDISGQSHLLAAYVKRVIQYPYTVIFICIVLLALFSYQIRHFYLEYDLEKIIYKDMPSIDTKKRVQQKFGQTNDFVMIVTNNNLEENRTLTHEIEKSSAFAQVFSISQFIPPTTSQEIRQQKLENIHRVLKTIKITNIPQKEILSFYEVLRIVAVLTKLQIDVTVLQEYIENPQLVAQLSIMEDHCRKLRKYIQSFENTTSSRKNLGYLQYVMAKNIKEIIIELQHMSIPHDKNGQKKIITVENLPMTIRDRFVSLDNESFVILAYPTNASFDANNINFLKGILDEIAPGQATGIHIITEKFITSGLEDFPLILGAVLLVLITILSLDFRNVKYLVFTCIPLFFSAIISVGIICSTDTTISILMLSALPLIFGIGIDDGVHVIHRYRENHDIVNSFTQTGKAIFLTTLTTVVSFGILMFTNHRGLIGMGLLVALGTSLCFVFSVTILPAILVIVDKPLE